MISGMHASEVPPRTPKKRGPLFWVIIGVASFVVLVMIAFGAIAYMGFRAAGLDREMLKDHPDYAATKLQVIANPNNEILEENIETGEIRYRDKMTGQVFVSKIDPKTHRLLRIPVTTETK